MTRPITIFYVYAKVDEALRQQLEKHLALLQRQGVLTSWQESQAGALWEKEQEQAFNKASLILLLVSADFLASDVCYAQHMQRALERERQGEVKVIPILLRPVDWKSAPFAHLQVLPTTGKPITSWSNQDAAFEQVAEGIRNVLEGKLLSVRAEVGEEARYFTENRGSVYGQVIGNHPIVHQHFYASSSLAPQPKSPSVGPRKTFLQPTNIRVLSKPSREGNKGMILFRLGEVEHALEYLRSDKIGHQILFLKEKQEELVRVEVPFATFKGVEKQAVFQVDGVGGLFTLKMSPLISMMTIRVEVGGVVVFHN